VTGSFIDVCSQAATPGNCAQSFSAAVQVLFHPIIPLTSQYLMDALPGVKSSQRKFKVSDGDELEAALFDCDDIRDQLKNNPVHEGGFLSDFLSLFVRDKGKVVPSFE
jgi:hypothetical protein